MEDSNYVPTSISHKQLNTLLTKARKSHPSIEHSITSHQNLEKKEEFKELTAKWQELSNEILSHLSKKKEYITEGKGANSLMALGAMEVHLNMAIQALKASQKE